jgi:Holliday junction DNA helicase RuvB
MSNFKSYIGQTPTIERLQIILKSCQITSSAIPHILFEGGPGLGKTSLATTVGSEYGVPVQCVNAVSVTTLKKLLPILSKITERSIVFIDEIHRLPIKLQESLYTVMENFKLDIATDKELINMSFPKFTLIGATTRMGLLQKPFLDRFQMHEILSDYTEDELRDILFHNALNKGVKLTDGALGEIASRAKFTPRIAKKLLEWVLCYARSHGLQRVEPSHVVKSFEIYGVDKNGLTEYDRRYLNVLRTKKVPVGLTTIADELGLSDETVSEYIEPYLIKIGMVSRTKKGRVLV